ncbi:MAG: hypothetical protein ACJ72H_16490 [Candidatus Sulfotelmatobacter sp.]|jgi:hypothetical protein
MDQPTVVLLLGACDYLRLLCNIPVAAGMEVCSNEWMPDPAEQRNQVMVDEVRAILHEAAQCLTPEIEPAFVYVLTPHPSADTEDLSEEK